MADDANVTRIVVDEAMVAEWLDNHPDFFDRHPGTLTRLDIHHADAGAASSLIERQIQTLRDRLAAMQQQFDEMVTTARENEMLQERVHRISIAATAAESLESATHAIPELLKDEFDIEHVAIRFSDEVAPGDTDHWALLQDRVSHGRSICDDRLPARVLNFLFADYADAVKSCAVLPLAREVGDVHGVIALGSTDMQRFNHAMGTVYLDRLAEIASSGLSRLRTNARAA